VHREKKETKLMELLEDRHCNRCREIYTPKVDWQKYCTDKCHDEYWKEVYREKSATNKRLTRLEKELGIKQ